MQIPFIKNRLSAKSVAIYFCLVTFLFIGAGAIFAKKTITVPMFFKYGYKYMKLYKPTLNRFSNGRIELNNNFFKDISGDYSRILFGDGLAYEGTEVGTKRRKHITGIAAIACCLRMIRSLAL